MSLEWLPAKDHLGLVAPVVRGAINEGEPWTEGLEVASIDPAISDTAAFMEHTGITAAQSANCLVVAGRRGDDERIAVCLVLATTRADVNRVVRKRLDVRRASFMTMDNAVGRTQMEFGGITPLGLPAEWPIWVDSRVMRQPWVVIGAGVRAAKLRIRGAAVGDLPGVEVVDGLAAEIG